MNSNIVEALSTAVYGELHKALKEHNILTAVGDLKSTRVFKYFRQPGMLLRDGWKLYTNERKCDRGAVRYWLGNRTVGQILEFDRKMGKVSLLSYCRRSEVQHTVAINIADKSVIHNELKNEPVKGLLRDIAV